MTQGGPRGERGPGGGGREGKREGQRRGGGKSEGQGGGGGMRERGGGGGRGEGRGGERGKGERKKEKEMEIVGLTVLMSPPKTLSAIRPSGHQTLTPPILRGTVPGPNPPPKATHPSKTPQATAKPQNTRVTGAQHQCPQRLCTGLMANDWMSRGTTPAAPFLGRMPRHHATVGHAWALSHQCTPPPAPTLRPCAQSRGSWLCPDGCPSHTRNSTAPAHRHPRCMRPSRLGEPRVFH